MPKSYSLDLRERVAGFVAAGHSRRAAAAHFAVSVSFVVRLTTTWRAEGRLDPKPAGGRRHAKLNAHTGCDGSEVFEFVEEALDSIALAIDPRTEGKRLDPIGHGTNIRPTRPLCARSPEGLL